MSFDREALSQAIARHGTVARIVVASSAGSVPREVGAAMVVWPGGQSGTIGGGALEYEATVRARAALATGDRVDKIPLGPGIGQCCGGAVTLLTEIWDASRLGAMTADPVVRPLPGAAPEMPLKLRRRLAAARQGDAPLRPTLIHDWFIEPLAVPQHRLCLWGAGHVGRAIAATLAPLPEWHLTWIDTGPDRFPKDAQGEILCAAEPQSLVYHIPHTAHHLVLTFSHALDLELCHRILGHGFASLGLIGSETKRARFLKRLAALGHRPEALDRLTCPIGDPSLGKHPQAIAIGVLAQLIARSRRVRLLDEAKSA